MVLKEAYLAGILDGEAYIGICSNGRNQKKRVTISVDSIDKELILWLVDNFGGFSSKQPRRKAHYSDIHTWKCKGKAACGLLRRALPAMVIERKRASAAKCLEWETTMR